MEWWYITKSSTQGCKCRKLLYHEKGFIFTESSLHFYPVGDEAPLKMLCRESPKMCTVESDGSLEDWREVKHNEERSV